MVLGKWIVTIAQIRELCRVMKGWFKGLMKVISDGLAIMKEWGMMVLLSERVYVGSRLVGGLVQ